MALMVPMKAIFFLMLAVSFLCHQSSHYGVVEGGRILSNEEDLELERQLKILNKPPVKTIQTEEGDTFDCIDIHKQPALDHPLLKNHKIQMRPTTQPKVSITKTPSKGARHSTSVLKRLQCPEGTTPIRRTRKEDLIRAKSFFESYPSSINEVTNRIPDQRVAIRKSKYTEHPNPYYGVHGYINTADPKVNADQFSTGQMWVEGGPTDQLNTLQAGWMVSPQLFGDNQTRLFAYSNTDEQHKQGCYNLLCQGFVQVDKETALGSVIQNISVYQGSQYALQLSIHKDVTGSGNWQLMDRYSNKLIGYWPKELFPNLQNGATSIAWGGLAKGSANGGSSPEMGNGHLPNHVLEESCSVQKLQVVHQNGDFTDHNEADFENLVSNFICYNLEYKGYIDDTLRFTFLFGGPGGDNCES